MFSFREKLHEQVSSRHRPLPPPFLERRNRTLDTLVGPTHAGFQELDMDIVALHTNGLNAEQRSVTPGC